ncbi:hypothetical protein [Haloarchaeobius sp. DYHT-AS-18]|uniref:hypothetical protein n=1 Tax=Haloarchaeobius sp. DYHT-AS-18 TaxID=3446117 RepID=UPI003EC0BD6A
MSGDTDPHRSPGEQHSNDQSDGVSRRSVLEGAGKVGAVSAIPFNQLTDSPTLGRSPGKGSRVIVLQGTPQNPVTPKQQAQARTVTRQDRVDKGNDPLDGYPASAHGSDDPLVGFVTAVAPDGTVQGYQGIASTAETSSTDGAPGVQSAQAIHGRAMAYGREYAKVNDSTLEIHTPNGEVVTHRPDDVGKDAGAGKSAKPMSLVADGTTTATIDQTTVQNIQDIRAKTAETVSTEGMESDPIYDDIREKEHDDWGRWETWTRWYVSQNRYEEDDPYSDEWGYALLERFTMNPGAQLHDNWWANETGIVHHDWGLDQHSYSDFPEAHMCQVLDWEPHGTQEGSHGGSVSISGNISSDSFGGSVGLSYSYSQPNLKVIDDTRTSDDQEEARLLMEVDGGQNSDVRENTISFKPSSLAKQNAPYCNQDTTIFRAWYQGVFQNGFGVEESISENWYHWYYNSC